MFRRWSRRMLARATRMNTFLKVTLALSATSLLVFKLSTWTIARSLTKRQVHITGTLENGNAVEHAQLSSNNTLLASLSKQRKQSKQQLDAIKRLQARLAEKRKAGGILGWAEKRRRENELKDYRYDPVIVVQEKQMFQESERLKPPRKAPDTQRMDVGASIL